MDGGAGVSTFQPGDAVRIAPQRGQVVRVDEYRIGRTKATAEIKQMVVVELPTGTRIRVRPENLIPVEEGE